MNFQLQTIQSLCPGLEPKVIQSHLRRLDHEYTQRFDPAVISEHLQHLCRLSAGNPVEVILRAVADRTVECTVLAFDHPFELSLITGVLTGTGINIESGDVFTLPTVRRGRADPTVRRRRGTVPRVHDPHRDAVIIDRFVGQLSAATDAFDRWAARFTDSITEVITLLERSDKESVDKAKHRVNELVTERLASIGASPAPMLYPVNLDMHQVEASRTRIRIVAQDTPAFLYSLSTALSLHGLLIHRVRIRNENGQACDEIDLVDPTTQRSFDQAMLERIKLSVLLTKQFTYFLDRSPDPFTALTRFERLAEDILRLPEQGQWIELLADPHTMHDLAKLLGTSDYLWEDFIRGQYESLLPIFRPHVEGRRFCAPDETLPMRLAQALEGATDLAEQQDRLNRFKDHEIFLIDLEHVLASGSDFRQLSRRLTTLAENLVAAAARLVGEDLVRTYGAPRTADGREARYAIFGLGKLGGVALGYASDIELLFVYDGDGKTAGGTRRPISNPEFFEQLTRETARFIKTKRAGIFEVDLRLRPHGKAGPLASSFNQFRLYYSHDGPAHAFEKLTLVRLRWIAGDSELGFRVEQLRNELVYDHPKIDLDAIWEFWALQRRQKTEPGRINAKYSPGALVDLEVAVQLIQVTRASKVPQLRTPRLSEVMDALRRAGVLSPPEFADLSGAYFFLRQLINALRMLRGSAQDLFLPPPQTDEFVHLARRMGYVPHQDQGPGPQLTRKFDNYTTAVRAFVENHFGRPSPDSVKDAPNRQEGSGGPTR